MPREFKGRVYAILEGDMEENGLSRYVNGFILALIILNVIAIILGSVQDIHDRYDKLLNLFEIFSVAVFTIEFLLRVWICTLNPDYGGPIKGRFKYVTNWMSLIDILAIAPFYIYLFFPLDLTQLMMFRVLRILRLLKIVRYSDSIRLFGVVIKRKRDDLMTALTIGLITLVISSTLMYFAEHQAQPEKFASILDAMWWGIVTLATIGYGDVYPVTMVGKFFGALTAIAGIAIFALPAGLLGSGFVEELEKRKTCGDMICPHCGKAYNEKWVEKPIIVQQVKK